MYFIEYENWIMLLVANATLFIGLVLPSSAMITIGDAQVKLQRRNSKVIFIMDNIVYHFRSGLV